MQFILFKKLRLSLYCQYTLTCAYLIPTILCIFSLPILHLFTVLLIYKVCTHHDIILLI